MSDKFIETGEIELIVENDEDSKAMDVTDFSIDYDVEQREGMVLDADQLKYEGKIELRTEALEELMEEIERQRFQAEARMLFALIGLHQASGGDMSVGKYLLRYVRENQL